MTSDELIKKLASHVKDSNEFNFPWGDWQIPEFLLNLGITKIVVLELIVAAIMLAVFLPMAILLRGGRPAKGRFWNMLEVLLVYLRDNVIVVGIGNKKDAAPYVPYLWTLFFFVLFCNLAGLIPGLGTPTGAIAITGSLAILTLIIVTATGIYRHGVVGFWTGMVPHIEGKVGPVDLKLALSPVLFVLEILSFFVKHVALCIRLMANMFGGGLIIAVLIAFIPMAAWAVWAWILVTPAAVLGSIAIETGGSTKVILSN